MYNPFDHPLIDKPITVELSDGTQEPTINAWGFAAMILNVLINPLVATPEGYQNSLAMAKHAISKANLNINADKLIEKCQQQNEGAQRQAHSCIASGIEILIDEKFKEKGE